MRWELYSEWLGPEVRVPSLTTSQFRAVLSSQEGQTPSIASLSPAASSWKALLQAMWLRGLEHSFLTQPKVSESSILAAACLQFGSNWFHPCMLVRRWFHDGRGKLRRPGITIPAQHPPHCEGVSLQKCGPLSWPHLQGSGADYQGERQDIRKNRELQSSA